MGLLRDGLGESTCTVDDSLLIPSSESTKFDCDCSLETSLGTYLSKAFGIRCMILYFCGQNKHSLSSYGKYLPSSCLDYSLMSCQALSIAFQLHFAIALAFPLKTFHLHHSPYRCLHLRIWISDSEEKFC